MGGRFHKHRVEPLLFQHFAVLLIDAPAVAPLHLLGGFADAAQVAIGHGDDISAGQGFVLKNPAGAPAHADNANPEPVVGAGAAWRAEGSRRHNHRKTQGQGGGRTAQEFAPVHRRGL